MPCKVIKYRKYIVTFIDIMGFTDLIESRFEGNSAPINKIIGSFIDTNKICSSIITPGGLEKQVKSHFFSDCIVRRIYIDGKSEEHILRTLNFEILQLALLQIYLLEQGVYIRGCINMGQLYGRKDIFFGKAFNDAYHYESHVAINPIIVLSNELHHYIKAAPSVARWDTLSMFASAEVTYNHGQPYINYLHMVVTNALGMSNQQTVAFLRAHKENIMKEISQHRNCAKVLIKYLWLKEYHNHYIDLLPELFSKEELLIR